VAENKFSLEDRLRYGNLEINEICELKPCSRSRFYQDVKAGLVEIRKVGSKSVVPGPIASGLAITVSLGVASIPETCGRQLELIPEADAALYAAKQQGRDRVVVAPLRTLARSLSLVETTSAVQTDRS
jgi:hypothetical protein